MFGHRYFGARYCGPRYFGDGGDVEGVSEILGRQGLGGDDAPIRSRPRERIEIWETRKRKVDAPETVEAEIEIEPVKVEAPEIRPERKPLTEQEKKEAARLAEILLYKPARLEQENNTTYATQIIVRPRRQIKLPFFDPIDDDDEDVFLLM